MMSLQVIESLAREQAVKAARRHMKPFVVEAGDAAKFLRERRFPFPNIGSYVPPGWKETRRLFCDKAGGAFSDGISLGVQGLADSLKVGMGYAIVEEGEFQLYVGEFEPPKRTK